MTLKMVEPCAKVHAFDFFWRAT